MTVESLITQHIDTWTSAVKTKSTSGRGNSKKLDLYGVKKLRELILELAVRGKLVPQDPNDEPASVLLERIAAKKAQLVKDKKIKNPKALSQICDDKPFPIPNSWIWSQLGFLTNYGVCDKAEPKDVATSTWVLELEDVEKSTSKLLKKVNFEGRAFKSSKNRFLKNDVIYGKLRPYLDKVLVADEDGVCTTEMIPIRGYNEDIVSEFLRLVLKTPYFIQYANSSTHGMNLPRMGTEKARDALIPLVPINEQHRIVAKVDELMSLCDKLEQQTEASIEAHQLLVSTLLNTLTNSADADELMENWVRISDYFDTLFTTEESIDQLKQTILQLAVMGKLVPQDPNDEPASVLLERIAEEKAKLIKEKVYQKSSKLKPMNKGVYYPNGWVSVQTGQVCPSIVPNRDRPKSFTGNIPWVTLPSFPKQSFYLDNNQVEFSLTSSEVEKYSARLIPEKSVLMSCVGRFGLTAINLTPVTSNQQVHAFIVLNGLLPEYLSMVIKVEGKLLENVATSTTIAYLNKTNCESIQFGLPPTNEQHLIIEKVKELFVFCDQLKARLKESQTIQLHLTDAIVKQIV
ncbi:restriction endonuclease subunit S [Photobacterium carnosum]|uniref:restriction endonuclease subunit S n=1 Tax=Photobacterium carnosum TaxID=2023717 RepID=UPI00128E3B76|nr:restriction endonuclease subunit S [Photobacterium carnosum]KAE8175751.1 restriction endonuclease [Photobacterium carnosum]MCD9554359.1 restriction endonuclease subunit S [Photobacterium carnosum]